MSVREFYDQVWDADMAGSRIIEPDQSWVWWSHIHRLEPFELRNNGRGLIPFCGTMVSHRVAEALVDTPHFFEAISELRLPTLATIHGFELSQLCEKEEDWNSFPLHAEHRYTHEFCAQGPGIYHRVKYYHDDLHGELLKENIMIAAVVFLEWLGVVKAIIQASGVDKIVAEKLKEHLSDMARMCAADEEPKAAAEWLIAQVTNAEGAESLDNKYNDDGCETAMSMEIRVTPVAIELLRELMDTGLYGHTIEQTAERVLCQGLLSLGK
jgi:hypothetical protein